MRPVAALVAMILLVLTAPLTGPRAAAATPGRPAPDAGPLSLQLTQLEPRVVTAAGPQTLTVVGTLTNTGDVPVADLEVRLQRGQPLGTEGALRDALDGNAATDAVATQFVPLPGELAPGAQLPVRLSVLLRGDADTSLALDATGVQELLVNVNGVPDGGARARLAAVRLLLPVLSLPPDPERPARGDATPVGPGPSGLTLLYPIADTPHRLSTVPGEPTLLSDDELATELAPEGRLGGLVSALQANAPVGSAVRTATCLAVDPDLVETAAAMRSGYQVRGPDGTPVPGTGAEVAGRWLDALTSTARGGCVLALPFADADLVALTRGGLAGLAGTAQVQGRQLLTQLLGQPVLDGVGWPADGAVDQATLQQLAAAGTRAVLLSADTVEPGRGPARTGTVPLAGPADPPFAVLTDPLLSRAATGPGAPNSTGGPGGAVPAGTPAGTVTPLSTQDTIGALTFRARSGPDRGGGPVVLALPHQWAADGTGATALLQGVDTLLAAGYLTPRPLDDVVTAGRPDAPTRSVSYPLRAGAREVGVPVVDSVRATAAEIEDLRSAAVPDSGVGLDPGVVLEPLVRGLLRPMSAAWRGRPDAAGAAAAAGAQRIAELRSAVRVLEPPSPFALGTANAPLLVTIGNGLPFTVRVRLEISSTSGLRVAPIEMQQVPPVGRRQVQLSAEVSRSGQFTVLAGVRSPDGQPFGPASRLRVRSTAYGTITVWLTASAGVLLVVLAVRRVRRRVRIEPPSHTGPIPVAPPPPGPSPPAPNLAAPNPPAPNAPAPPIEPARPDRPVPLRAAAPARSRAPGPPPAGPPRPAPDPAGAPRPAPRPAPSPVRGTPPPPPNRGGPTGDPFPPAPTRTEEHRPGTTTPPR